MKRIVVLGGGVGGTMVANRLVRELANEVRRGEIEVTLVAEEGVHQYQPGYLFVAFNHAPMEHFEKPQKNLLVSGVKLVNKSAKTIDPKTNSIKMADGGTLKYDYLVISTGSHPTMETVPGLAEDGNTFYTAEEAEKLRDKLLSLDGGRIVVAVDVPHKCPVAPLEFTFMLDDYLKQLGKRNKFEIIYTYPIGRLHSLVPVAEWAEPEFQKRGIQSEVYFNIDHVDPVNHVVESLEGSSYNYDLLVVVPAHRGAKVILDSGIGDEGGWIPTDRYTLRMEGSENVYVLGDATNLPVSKAGSTAHYQADVVVSNIIDNIKGLPANHRYDGKVFCFIEGGLDKATYISFSYTNPPQPNEPSEMLHWFKLMYNEIYWLSVRGLL